MTRHFEDSDAARDFLSWFDSVQGQKLSIPLNGPEMAADGLPASGGTQVADPETRDYLDRFGDLFADGYNPAGAAFDPTQGRGTPRLSTDRAAYLQRQTDALPTRSEVIFRNLDFENTMKELY